MFIRKYKYSIAALTCMVAALACKKDIKEVMLTDAPGNSAYLKIVHASPSFRSLYNTADTFNVFANSAKINGLFITYAGTFPHPTANGYQAIAPGTASIKLATPGATTPDSAEVKTISKSLEPGKYYSLIITDSLSMPRDSSQIWLNDQFSVPATNLFALRFVHAVMNDTAGKAIDVYSARRNGIIISNYTPGRASAFVNYPYNQQVPDTLIVRRTGTSQELARLNNISFANQRVYTLLYRGNADLTTTNKARALTYYVNK